MCKYKDSVGHYEKSRQLIVSLTRDIGEASIDPCKNPQKATPRDKIPFGQVDCVERYWQARLERKHLAEDAETADLKLKAKNMEIPKLCSRCKKIDELVNKRKDAKRKFGAAKRRISMLGKGV